VLLARSRDGASTPGRCCSARTRRPGPYRRKSITALGPGPAKEGFSSSLSQVEPAEQEDPGKRQQGGPSLAVYLQLPASERGTRTAGAAEKINQVLATRPKPGWVAKKLAQQVDDPEVRVWDSKALSSKSSVKARRPDSCCQPDHEQLSRTSSRLAWRRSRRRGTPRRSPPSDNIEGREFLDVFSEGGFQRFGPSCSAAIRTPRPNGMLEPVARYRGGHVVHYGAE